MEEIFKNTNIENETYRNLLKNQLEAEDKEYLNSKERENQGWRVHSKYKRMFITEFGKVIVHLTRYWKWNETKTRKITKIFSNDFLEKNKNVNIVVSLKEKICSLYTDKKSSKEISKYFGSNFSKWTVFNSFKVALKNKEELEQKEDKFSHYKELAKDKNIIHIDIDDTFHKEKYKNKKKKTIYRTVVLHLGFNNKKERKMIGKVAILEIKRIDEKKKTIKEWSDLIKTKIKEIYGKEFKEINVYGDGARWIKNLAKELNANYFLDYYHLKAKGFKVLGYTKTRNKANKEVFKDYEFQINSKVIDIYDRYVDKFELHKCYLFLIKLIVKLNNVLTEEKRKEMNSLISYIKNNINSLKNTHISYIGSHTETWMNHLIKKKIKKEFSIYNITTIKKILILNEDKNTKYIFC
ncbi:hypothetical protein VO56_02145 [Mycoplasmopsis gallinacea]|uniref:Transposase n=1 Tax=Mycoplasmopsis gallinacea TaxID=29556 RepID=A0A0D5ZK67_9BACT|nr:hypothetical protein VO56_02145 [Mycoplasmopsis gallinacea]